MNAEIVALGVLEPGRLLCPQHAHVLDRLQSREVVVLENNASLLQLGDAGADVSYLEADRRVVRPCSFGLREERQGAASTE